MKLNGETDEKITKYINIHWYKRILKKSGKELIMNSKNIGKIWVDEFYYGILIHWEATQDLREVNPYYKPVISEEQFQILKDRKEDRNKRWAVTKKKDVYEEISPFSNEFILTEDWYRLTFTLPNVQRFKKKLEKEKKENPKTTLEDVVNLDQMWFRCANRNSQFHNYQVKADAVDSAILDMLQGFTIWEKEYNEYVDFAKQQIDKIDYENKEKRVKKTLELNRIDSQKKEYIKNNMWKVRDDEERMIYNRERDTYDAKLAYIKKEIDDIDKEERNEIFEIEVLVGTMHNIPKYYKKLSNVRKRYITEILFSNVVLDHEKRLHIQVKPWFENLFSVNGGPAGARTQDLKLKRLPL